VDRVMPPLIRLRRGIEKLFIRISKTIINIKAKHSHRTPKGRTSLSTCENFKKTMKRKEL